MIRKPGAADRYGSSAKDQKMPAFGTDQLSENDLSMVIRYLTGRLSSAGRAPNPVSMFRSISRRVGPGIAMIEPVGAVARRRSSGGIEQPDCASRGGGRRPALDSPDRPDPGRSRRITRTCLPDRWPREHQRKNAGFSRIFLESRRGASARLWPPRPTPAGRLKDQSDSIFLPEPHLKQRRMTRSGSPARRGGARRVRRDRTSRFRRMERGSVQG